MPRTSGPARARSLHARIRARAVRKRTETPAGTWYTDTPPFPCRASGAYTSGRCERETVMRKGEREVLRVALRRAETIGEMLTDALNAGFVSESELEGIVQDAEQIYRD